MIKVLNRTGFTLVELMLAMSMFSIIFILSTVGFIGINRTYTRGMIKKQLSESVQLVTDNVSSVLQSFSPSFKDCTTGGDGCPQTSYSIHAICFTGTRYVWPIPVASNPGGLYRDNKNCDDALDTSSAQEIVDPRFVIEDLKVRAVSSSPDLYQLTGVLHTSDLKALTNNSDGQTTADRMDASFDAYALKCKGTSAGSVVQSCAVEKFDTIISIRGSVI